jgi:hypothetical protein
VAWIAAAAGLFAWLGWRLRRPVVVVATAMGPPDGPPPSVGTPGGGGPHVAG